MSEQLFRKNHGTQPGDDASTAEAVPGRVGRGSKGRQDEEAAHREVNLLPHREHTRKTLKKKLV